MLEEEDRLSMSPDSNHLFRSLYQHAPIAVIAADTDRTITAVNPSAERLFGYEAEALIGRNTQIIYADPRDYDRLGRTTYAQDAPENTQTSVVRFKTRTGRIFSGETVGCPIQDEAGNRSGYICIIRDITERLALQARVEASDIQLRAALSSANEGAYSLNLITGLGSIRGFINEFLGIHTPDATISTQKWLEIIHPDDREAFQRALKKVANQPGASMDIIHRAERSDGAWRWLHNRGQITEFTRDGNPLRLTGVVSDVTDRRELEMRLAESERLLREAVNTSQEGAWQVDFANNIALLTGIYTRLFGSDEDVVEVSREAWMERVHPDDVPIARQAWAHLLETGIAEGVYRVQDPDGGWVWVHNRGRVTESDVDGNPLRASGLTSDITERKGLEDRVANSESLLRNALEAAEYGAWSMDLSDGRLTVSGLLERLLDPDETGLPLTREQVHARMTDRSRTQSLKDVSDLSAGDSIVSEYEIVSADGAHHWIRDNGRVVEWNESGTPIRAAGISSDITEEKRLRSEIRQSQTRLQEALDAAGEGAWRLNLKTRIADISSVISQFMGLPPKDARVTYDDWADRIHPDDRAISDAALSDLVTGASETVDFIVRYQSELPGWRRIHNRGKISQRDETGAPVHATGFMADITERVLTAERLAERDQQLSDAIEAASLSVWRIDLATQHMWSQGPLTERIMGVETVEFDLSDWNTRVHSDDFETLQHANRALVTGEDEVFDQTYRIRLADGQWIWIRATGRVIARDDAGRAVTVSGAIQDIDEAKRLNDALTEERLRFETIYRASPAMMHTIDSEGVIVEVSDYWLAYLGYARDEVIGRKSIDFLDEESRERAEAVNLPHLFETGRNTNLPYRFIRKDGEILDVLLSSFLERDDTGAPLFSFAVMTDITPLRTAYEQLERSNRELDRFATVASHDLQEPLRKIAAFASLIRRRYAEALDDDGERCLDFLVDAAHRMQQLIDDLLAYSKMSSQPLKVETVALTELIDDVLDRLAEPISTSQADIVVADLPEIRGDQFLLGQVLQNLVSNAIKYSGEDQPRVEIGASETASEWTIWVQDNGIGLEPRFAEKIFQPFQRLHTREEFQGTGIGLAIVRQAVERLGGKVWVESELGQGARFVFTLPRPQIVDLSSTAS